MGSSYLHPITRKHLSASCPSSQSHRSRRYGEHDVLIVVNLGLNARV